MDAPAFDRLVKSLTDTPSRRGALRLLAGSLLAGPIRGLADASSADARRKKRKKRKKKCKGGTLKCGGKCCSAASCIDGACCSAARTCGTICCAADEVCADPETELCVVGQGTCPSGANSCGGSLVICNGACGCVQSTSGATRCRGATVDSDCGQCTTDADCEVVLGLPGAFCVKFFGGGCPCADRQNACFLPCETPIDPP